MVGSCRHRRKEATKVAIYLFIEEMSILRQNRLGL